MYNPGKGGLQSTGGEGGGRGFFFAIEGGVGAVEKGKWGRVRRR